MPMHEDQCTYTVFRFTCLHYQTCITACLVCSAGSLVVRYIHSVRLLYVWNGITHCVIYTTTDWKVSAEAQCCNAARLITAAIRSSFITERPTVP